MKNIYVIVLVTYDYYRFQENLGASTSLKKARAMANNQAKERDGIPVIEDAEKSQAMRHNEEHHIWIEKHR